MTTTIGGGLNEPRDALCRVRGDMIAENWLRCYWQGVLVVVVTGESVGVDRAPATPADNGATTRSCCRC
jgi:hypothetical protein